KDDLLYLVSYLDGIALKALKPIVVGFLGPRGSFAEEACLKVFSSQGVNLIAYTSIRDVFRGVEAGEIDYGVVPLENSLEGSVGETLDMLAQTSAKICGETEVKISLNLIAKPGTKIENIKVVLSHPMALAQCRNFIYTKLKNVVVETRSSTSEAVKEAVEREGVAAIGSELAAKIYGGEILIKGIEDYRENYTRFIVIGYKPLDIGVSVKTSIILTLKDVPGSLYRALEPFATRGINLTKIESRPIKGRPWEYMFFIDFTGSIEDPVVREAIDELTSRTTSIKVLGSYRKIP
ncbi:MAG: prephenate dehydratase, partial [Ignisphaera sp.]